MTKISRAIGAAYFSACRKTFFDTLGDCQKGSEDKQLTLVGVYRYGRA